MNAAVDIIHHRIDGIGTIQTIDHKGKIFKAFEFAMQRGKRTFICADILGKLLDIRPINRKQLAQPAVFVHRVNEIGRFRSRRV